MSFSSLKLDTILCQHLKDIGYKLPTLIQKETIPHVLSGNDVMARAQTGTGKTAAFALPLINKLISLDTTKTPRILVLVPTRELAQQVHSNICTYASPYSYNAAVIHGGVSGKDQIQQIQSGAEIVIGTPCRLIDNLRNNDFKLDDIVSVVLDEADRMLDLGFKDEINHILSLIPKERQTLLFSATFNDDVYKFSKNHQSNVEVIKLDESNTIATSIKQIIYTVDESRKRELTSFLIGSKNWHQVLVFTRTKKMADLLAKEMTKDGVKSLSIHSDKSQGARNKALASFKDKSIRALIATDVAARGIDISNLSYVINYELPYQAEDYIHRIGRTGRAGSNGIAVSLVSSNEAWLVEAIEKVTNEQLLQEWFPGFEPDLSAPQSTQPPRKENKRTTRNKALSRHKPRSKR